MKSVTKGGRATYKLPSPERTSFRNKIDSPVCERCLENDETATHFLWECHAVAYPRFRHLGHYFMLRDDCRDTPLKRIFHSIASVGLLKGQNTRIVCRVDHEDCGARTSS
jgi:hypothetical protein